VRRSVVALVAAGAWGLQAGVEAVGVSYRIDANGTGPGVVQATDAQVLNHGPVCAACRFSDDWDGASCCSAATMTGFKNVTICPQGAGCWGNCFFGGTNVTDAAPGPAKVTWSFMGPPGWWGGAIVVGPGVGYCGSAMSGEVSGYAPGPIIWGGGSWGIMVGSWGWCGCSTEPWDCCTNPGFYTFSVTFTYMKRTDHADWTCSDTGTREVPTDGAWHLIATSKCAAPDGNTSWAVKLFSVTPTALVEGKMVADPGDPSGGPGPNLIARAKELQPCPPNCPPPQPCLDCVASGHTIAECQALGACPKNCPPYCPPPPGCPPTCPPPPKCPPYCPPPAGCPPDCPPGCPPICPPPAGCPPVCPEPPGCPPNCAPECME